MKASLKRWIGRVPDVSDVIARFPVAVGIMVVFTICVACIDLLDNTEYVGRMMMGLVIGAYSAMMITVAREARGKSRLIPLQIAFAAFLAIIFWFSKELRLNLLMALGATLALLGNAVLWRKARNDLHVWDFTHKIWTGGGFAALGCALYAFGIIAITQALKSLFGINIEQLAEHVLFPVGFGLLAPLFWLGTIPPVDEPYDDLVDKPGFVSKAVGFLGTWILAPLTLIYAAILVAYAAKIILEGSLPKGEIAQLTTPFLLIGSLTWLALEPPFTQKFSLAKLFRKLWWPVSLPATVMLAIAIGVRVQEYGLTEERLALILVVFWAFSVALWLIFGPKAKRDIRLIPGIGAGLLIAGAITAGWLSLHNQTNRAKHFMKAAGITSETGVIKPRSEITITDEAAAAKAKGALRYLEGHRGWPAIERMFVGADDVPTENGKPKQQLYERLALQDISTFTAREQFLHYNRTEQAYDISAYDLSEGIYWLHPDMDMDVTSERTGLILKMQDGAIFISDSEKEIGTIDVITWVKRQAVTDMGLDVEDPVIPLQLGGGQRLAIVVQDVSYQVKEDKIESLSFQLLTAGF